MGCDIHWVVEVKDDESGKWIGVLSDDYCDVPACNRWYSFFSEFGARGESDTAIKPRGLPDDISDFARLSRVNWDHSQSWATMEEFKAAWDRACVRAELPKSSPTMFGDVWTLKYPPQHDEYRVVFAFDS